MIDRVPDEKLQEFLSAADSSIIPYRKNVSGVSVPSRFYNLLAVGRAVLIISVPDAEATLTVMENALGWVVPKGRLGSSPGRSWIASFDNDIKILKSAQAAAIAVQFSRTVALATYPSLGGGSLRKTSSW